VLRRVIYVAIEIFFAFTLSFFLLELMPGNPYYIIYYSLINQGVNPEQAKVLAAALSNYNPNVSVFTRYFEWMWGLIHGNLGYSIVYATPVAGVVAAAAPWTILIVTISLTLAFSTGFIFGLLAASTTSRFLDALISGSMSVFHSIPSYVLAVFLLIIFSIRMRLFPMGGAYANDVTPGLNGAYLLSVMDHLALPILTFYLMLFPRWVFGARAIATSVTKEDYVLTAKARGIKGRRMLLSYIGRNAMLPEYTALLYSYGLLFGSSIFIESIFDIPGLGYVLSVSTGSRDYLLAMGTFMVIIIAVILGNLIADLTYGLIDPRARAGGENA